MRIHVRWAVLGLLVLLAACAEKHPIETNTQQGPQAAAKPAPAATSSPAAATNGGTTTPPLSAADAEDDLAKLPPLDTIGDARQRQLETARRALVKAKADLAAQSHAQVAEDAQVAQTALRGVQGQLAADSQPAKLVAEVLEHLDRELPSTVDDAGALAEKVRQARGPLPMAVSGAGSTSGMRM